MTPSQQLDEIKVRMANRKGTSTQFGKGEHVCLGQNLGKILVLDTLWSIINGDETHSGYDVEIVSGVTEGGGIDNVGVEAAWIEQNTGTPFARGDPVMVKFHSRA